MLPELPDFHFDERLEMKLLFALGDSYHHIGRNDKAKEALEKAWTLCNTEGMKETYASAEVARILGWTYQ